MIPTSGQPQDSQGGGGKARRRDERWRRRWVGKIKEVIEQDNKEKVEVKWGRKDDEEQSCVLLPKEYRFFIFFFFKIFSSSVLL